MIQLDFFQEEPELRLQSEIDILRGSVDKMRKGLYARHNSISSKLDDISDRLAIIEQFICKSSK